MPRQPQAGLCHSDSSAALSFSIVEDRLLSMLEIADSRRSLLPGTSSHMRYNSPLLRLASS
uniref:Uncharacterized protein n=1 Tax=uncultured marine virus TaxID=186617 RepID=A0A0F7L4P3_9VIRU|nr:hypothetical protein [uncultured marine virus]